MSSEIFINITKEKKENEIDCNEQMEVKKRFKKID
jgi:hypothetical protein